MNVASGSPSPTLASPVTGTLMAGMPGGTSNSSPVVGLRIETASCAPFDSDVLLDPAIRSVVPSARATATAGNRGRVTRCLRVMCILLRKKVKGPVAHASVASLQRERNWRIHRPHRYRALQRAVGGRRDGQSVVASSKLREKEIAIRIGHRVAGGGARHADARGPVQ